MSKNYTNIQKLDNITGSIDDNSDVELSGLIDGQFLKYSAESGAWLPSSSGDFVSLSINGTGLSVVGHTHNIGNISGFNSGVSGLLPVVDILAGSGISVLSNSSIFTISVTGTFGLTSEEVDDRVAELLQPGTGISLDYNDNLDILTINTIGLQPSGDYSVVGHSHIITDISGLQNALDNKQPTGVYAPLDSPIFTGTPIVPTATTGTNTNQIASTAFVRTEISHLVNSAPETLDTLQELANALGNDNNFSSTIASGLASKANLGGANFTGSISSPTGNLTTLIVNDYIFPLQDGFANQYLQTDGLGNLSWTNIAGGTIIEGTGISGYLSKWNSSDTITSGIIYDNGNNIGIGTSFPLAKLHIRNPNTFQNPNVIIHDSSDLAAGVGASIILGGKFNTAGSYGDFAEIKSIKESSANNNASAALAFFTTNVADLNERMRITSSGSVGIGVSTPLARLHVDGNGIFASGLNISNQTASAIASFDSNKNIVSLPTVTYPSLTELSYVK